MDTTRWGTVGALVLFGHLGAFATLYAWLPEVPASDVGTGVVTAMVSLEVGGGVPIVSPQPKVETVKTVEPVTPLQKPEVQAPEVVEPRVEENPQVKDTVKPPPVKTVQAVKTVKPKEPVKPKAVSKLKALSKTSATATPKATPSRARISVKPSSTPSADSSSVPLRNPKAANTGVSSGAGTTDYVGPSASADYLKNPHPKYPKISLRRKEAGTVLLALTVTAEGRAKDVRVLKTSGYPRLDKAALDAVKDWRFIPAKRLGRPVDADYELPIHFKLRQ